MSEPAAAQSAFAEVVPQQGVLWVRMIGPSIGQREVQIITDMVVPAVEQMGKGLRHLVLEVSQITFMNSMGLGMFINFRNLAGKTGGAGAKTIIMGMNGELLDLFKMVKVDRLYTIVKDNAELQKALAK